MPWSSQVNAVAGPGRVITRDGVCASSNTVMPDGADGSASGVRTTSRRAPLSYSAACGWPLNGRITPAGAWETGGDTAGCAGWIVGGAVCSGFDEQAVTNVSKAAAAQRQR
ncbi:conserved lipoLppL domain protein [Mycobacterium kansasii]|uniref:Conserved lipoLppL domain protein n=1 Tax=Mycobacterium kansasii TaxID=1768 RepID=A0A1V3X4Z4_MYCKA|nr:conserved lipoLppL domain protein [Mycobacterium kansasii]